MQDILAYRHIQGLVTKSRADTIKTMTPSIILDHYLPRISTSLMNLYSPLFTSPIPQTLLSTKPSHRSRRSNKKQKRTKARVKYIQPKNIDRFTAIVAELLNNEASRSGTRPDMSHNTSASEIPSESQIHGEDQALSHSLNVLANVDSFAARYKVPIVPSTNVP